VINYTRYRLIFYNISSYIPNRLGFDLLYLDLDGRILLTYVCKYVGFDYINSIYLTQEWEPVVRF
jgi:hypothetical protein